MEELNYTSTKIFTRNKQGELIQKRVKAAQVCPGLLVTPEKFGMVDLIIDYNGIKWREAQVVAANIDNVCKRAPLVLKSIAGGHLLDLSDYHKEMHRRIFTPDAPAVMELKKPERKPKQPTMNINGTIRAKVLQYKADGNTLTEKWETLTKFAEGVYYTKDTDDYGQNYAYFIFERNGLYWQSMRSDRLERIAERREKIKADYTNFESSIFAAVNENRFIGKLQLEVMKRLGHDVAPLLASRAAYLKQREEEERQKAAEAQRREMERKEAEERHNAEQLAKGKKNLLGHKAVTVEQIELLAESVGYKINIRTLGFMRKKVAEAALMEDGRVTVWGRKLTSRNIDGTANVLDKIAELLKAQAEEHAKHSAQAAEALRVKGCKADTEKVSQTANKPQEPTIKIIPDEPLITARAAPCALVDTPPVVRRLPSPLFGSPSPHPMLKYSLIAHVKNHSFLNLGRSHGHSRPLWPPYATARSLRSALRSPKGCAYLYASHTLKKSLIARMKNQRILPIRGSPPHNRAH